MGDTAKIQTANGQYEGVLKLRTLRWILLAINILAVIPIMAVAVFNVPSADDFSMAFEVHEAYAETGSVFLALAKAIYMGFWYYMNWTGYFFSDALTAFAPSVFGEHLYFLGTWAVLLIVTFGLWFFLRQLCITILKQQSNLTGCITSVIYFLLIHTVPEGAARCESFFWYSGAVNYMFMFGLALLWLGLMIGTIENRKTYRVVLLSVLGFLLGGANYMTALSLAIVSACIIFITIISELVTRNDSHSGLKKVSVFDACIRLSSVKTIVIPAVFMIMGFIVSVIAPGNKVRSEAPKFGPIKAVKISLYYTLEKMFGEWLTWPVVFLIILALPLLWKAAGRARKRVSFSHPLLFAAFAFLLSAANITPAIYATGNIEAGRITGIYYMQSMLLLMLLIGYACGFLQSVGMKVSEPKAVKNTPKTILFEGYLGKSATGIVIWMAVMFLMGSAISVKVNPYLYTGTAALADIAGGSAARYRQEFDKRLSVLKDEGTEDAEFEPFTVKPELLFFSDITTDEKDWLNKAVADYYHKRSVKLIENDRK